MMSFDQRAYTTGSAYAWSLAAPTRDGGSAWDVTGALEVRLYLHQPGGSSVALGAVLVGGVWQASWGPPVLTPGVGQRPWDVIDAAGPHLCIPISFIVTAAP